MVVQPKMHENEKKLQFIKLQNGVSAVTNICNTDYLPELRNTLLGIKTHHTSTFNLIASNHARASYINFIQRCKIKNFT